jgi:hypothetical protein
MESVLGYEYRTRTHLLVTDEDAADFLQSQFTNELRPFEAGQCTYGLWLDVKGKVLADSYVLCEGDEQFRIVSEYSEASVLTEKLEHHIIADDVEIEVLEPASAFSLIGTGATSLLEALGYEIPVTGRYSERDGVVVFVGRRSLLPGFELICTAESSVGPFREALIEANVDFVPEERIQRERISAGIPLIPMDIGPGDMPGEGGLERDAVSFTKGCYLGQEVVARMHNVGRPQRGLFVVSGSGEPPECPIALYNAAAKKVGELRTVAQAADGWTGVALLKTRHAAIGEGLTMESETVSIVRNFCTQGDAEK